MSWILVSLIELLSDWLSFSQPADEDREHPEESLPADQNCEENR